MMRRSLPTSGIHRGTPTRKLIRKSASAKDIRFLSDRVTLEHVLGLTTSNTNGLTCNAYNGIIAYPAGCVIVLFNARTNSQSHILNPEKKTLTALTFSSDGKYLASGESGHNPRVRVWELGETINQVAELNGHKFSINCVAFSPNLKYLVSIGDQHDMMVNIWNWKTGSKVACNKIGCKVRSVSFAENGSYFVTVGNRHVKFWYFDTEVGPKSNVPTPVAGRSGILGELRNNCFCDVVCGIGDNSSNTYAVTKSGLLCSFNEKRILDRWVELRSSGASSLAANEKYVFCGCTDGIIRVFHPTTMHFISSLPKPHFLGVDVAAGLDASHMITKDSNVKYPDVVSLVLDNDNDKLSCVYNDHSLYVWDIQDVKKVGKACSFLYHSACIWGVETYPVMNENSHPRLPTGSFLTCSSDDTIRVWNIEAGIPLNSTFPRNIYSKELLKIIYTDEDLANIQDVSCIPVSTSSDMKTGVRCLQVSPDGQLLAAGDRSGNLRVYDLQFVDEIIKIEAHEAEILCVEFSDPKSGYRLLATSSRDRLIHIFDIDKDFALIQTIDDHASSVTAVRLNYDEGIFQLLSCGADKHIMLHTAQQVEDGKGVQFVRENTIAVGKATLYDMDIDPTRKFATTCGQDRNVRIYDIQAVKQTHCYKGSVSEDGTLIKIQLDPSGLYAATSCSDKSVNIYDFEAGDCAAVMYGHSELVTGLKFMPDGSRLISVSGDHCIFVWRLVPAFTQAIITRLKELGKLISDNPNIISDHMSSLRNTFVIPKFGKDDLEDVIEEDEFSSADPNIFEKEGGKELEGQFDYRFSVGQLPAWAQKQITGETENSEATSGTGLSHPSGRWAQRITDAPIVLTSALDKASSNSNLSNCNQTIKERGSMTINGDTISGEASLVDDSVFQRGTPYSNHHKSQASKAENVIYIPSSQEEFEADMSSSSTSSLKNAEENKNRKPGKYERTLASIDKIKRKIISKSSGYNRLTKSLYSKCNTVESPKSIRRASTDSDITKSHGKITTKTYNGKDIFPNKGRKTIGSAAPPLRRISLPILATDKISNRNKSNDESADTPLKLKTAKDNSGSFEVHYMDDEQKLLNEILNPRTSGYGSSADDQTKIFQVTARASVRSKKNSGGAMRKESTQEQSNQVGQEINDVIKAEVDADSLEEEEEEIEDDEELTDSEHLLSDHEPGDDEDSIQSPLEQHFEYLAEDINDDKEEGEKGFPVIERPRVEQNQKKGQSFLSRCRSSISAKFLSRSQKMQGSKNYQLNEEQRKRIDSLKRVIDQNQNYGSSKSRTGQQSKEARRMKKLSAKSEPNLSIGIPPAGKTSRKSSSRRGSGVSSESQLDLRSIKEGKISEDDFQSKDRLRQLRGSSTSSMSPTDRDKSASELINLFSQRSSTPKHKPDLLSVGALKPAKTNRKIQRGSPSVSPVSSPVSSPTKFKPSGSQWTDDKLHESAKEIAVKRRPRTADERPFLRHRPKSLIIPSQTSLDELLKSHCSQALSDTEIDDDDKPESKRKRHKLVQEDRPARKSLPAADNCMDHSNSSLIVRDIEIGADDSVGTSSASRKSWLDNTVIFTEAKGEKVINEERSASKEIDENVDDHEILDMEEKLNIQDKATRKANTENEPDLQTESSKAHLALEAEQSHENATLPSSIADIEGVATDECQMVVDDLLESFKAISRFQDKTLASKDLKHKDEILEKLSQTYITLIEELKQQKKKIRKDVLKNVDTDMQAKEIVDAIVDVHADKTKQVFDMLGHYSNAIVKLVEMKLAAKP